MFRVTMETIDPTEEYRRLKELYAQMSDGQLQVMAGQIDDMTDVAKEVLRAEISRRGLDVHPPEGPGKDSAPSEEDLTRIWVAEDSKEAQAVMDALESNGIPACLGTEKMEFVDGSFEEKSAVKVVTPDQGRALQLFAQYFPWEEESEEEDERVAVCPSCHSPDIVFQSLDTEPASGTAAKFNWTCDACGYRWRDDGLEQLA